MGGRSIDANRPGARQAQIIIILTLLAATTAAYATPVSAEVFRALGSLDVSGGCDGNDVRREDANRFHDGTCALELTQILHSRTPRRVKAETAPVTSPLSGTVIVTLISFALGATLIVVGRRTLGMLAVYFGAQSGFNLYMKIVLSSTTVSTELGMDGIPAAFFLTAVQQVITFFVCLICILGLRMSPWRRPIRRFTTRREWWAVLLFSFAFAANHGFNNFSLSLLEVSLNLVLRSCIPLMTISLQGLFKSLGVRGYGESVSKTTLAESLCMVVGVLFAAMATLSESRGNTSSPQHVMFGTSMGVLSIFFAALNMLCAAELGSDLKVEPLDANCYCALPAAALLTVPMLLISHPSWPGYVRMTDWQVVQRVLNLSPETMTLVVVSGLMSVMYSFLQYWLIINLSAAYTAFAGNFNKALCIVVSVVLGVEQFPTGVWCFVMIGAVIGNASAFAGYGLMKSQELTSAGVPPNKAKQCDNGCAANESMPPAEKNLVDAEGTDVAKRATYSHTQV